MSTISLPALSDSKEVDYSQIEYFRKNGHVLICGRH